MLCFFFTVSFRLFPRDRVQFTHLPAPTGQGQGIYNYNWAEPNRNVLALTVEPWGRHWAPLICFLLHLWNGAHHSLWDGCKDCLRAYFGGVPGMFQAFRNYSSHLWLSVLTIHLRSTWWCRKGGWIFVSAGWVQGSKLLVLHWLSEGPGLHVRRITWHLPQRIYSGSLWKEIGWMGTRSQL